MLCIAWNCILKNGRSGEFRLSKQQNKNCSGMRSQKFSKTNICRKVTKTNSYVNWLRAQTLPVRRCWVFFTVLLLLLVNGLALSVKLRRYKNLWNSNWADRNFTHVWLAFRFINSRFFHNEIQFVCSNWCELALCEWVSELGSNWPCIVCCRQPKATMQNRMRVARN